VTGVASRTDFQEKFVDADGFHIRYLEAGSGPPLVHIHSAGGLRISDAHKLLARSYRVLALEVPGYSGSPNNRSQSLADLGGSLVSAVRALGLERFNLWGTSFGGAVALWAAFGSPGCIDALVLEGPGAIQPEGGFPEVRSPEDLHKYLWAHPDRHPLAAPVATELLAQRRSLLARVQAGITREDVEQRLSTLDVPTLVIIGTRDQLTPPDLGRIYREKMPRCQFVLLYDAAHEAAAERPEAFASLVSDFLIRGEAFIVNERSSLLHP
jgi:pimeloyl-ACP methyl ester carboxylesterase